MEVEGRGTKRDAPAAADGGADGGVGTDVQQQQQPLAASEYPISIDSLLPLLGQNGQTGTPELVGFDVRTAPSAIRHNSIHRYSLSTRTIAHYCRLEQIGEGTYGQVYRAECLAPTLDRPEGGTMVALKKIRLHHPGYMGIPPTVVREIKILKKLQHHNLVKMYEVVSSKGVEELDWEDEREDERRKKESNRGGNNGGKNENSTPANQENMSGANVADHQSSKKHDDKKSGSIVETKKKKKDSMSDLEKLRESYKGNLFLVLEYISHDLTGLLDMAYKFTEVQTKSIIKQLLEVLEFMHLRNYVHRDLKSSNVLITDKFEVKLADFGLARCLESSFIGRMGSDHNLNASSNEGEYTNKVITLWYRPPELLLGETKYGTAVDIWSAGCILAEVILGRPIFTGKTDMDQLKLIFDLIGTPNDRTWEGFSELKLIRTGEVTLGERPSRPKLREKYRTRIQPATALDLLEKTLELDPRKRFTASGALRHRYFQSEPVAPDDARELGTIDLGSGDGGAGYHEFQTKKRRREAKAVAKGAEEEAKARGESVEKQKEAFDRAYRDHLKKGAGAAAQGKKETAPWQQRPREQQHPREQRRESRPWEEYQERQHQHRHDGPKQWRAFDGDEDPSFNRGRYHHGRAMEGTDNVNTSVMVEEKEPILHDGGYPNGHLDQRGRRMDGGAADRPARALPPGRRYDEYGNPIPIEEGGVMPGAVPDRNRPGQEPWGWGSRGRFGRRPPGRGPPHRGGRGVHQSWPRNVGHGKEDGGDRR